MGHGPQTELHGSRQRPQTAGASSGKAATYALLLRRYPDIDRLHRLKEPTYSGLLGIRLRLLMTGDE